MSDSTSMVELHGCIVCGKIYNLLVVYDPAGKLVDCTVTSPGGKIVPDAKPLAACARHTHEQVRAALEKHYPGRAVEDQEDD